MDRESSEEGVRDRSGSELAVPVLGYRAPEEEARRPMPYKAQVRLGAMLGVVYMVYCTFTGLRLGMWSYGVMSVMAWFWVGVRWLPFLSTAGWVWRRRALGWGPAEVKALLTAGALMIWLEAGRSPFLGAGPIAGLLAGLVPLVVASGVTLSRPRWRGIGVGLIIGVGVTLLVGVGGIVVICGNMKF